MEDAVFQAAHTHLEIADSTAHGVKLVLEWTLGRWIRFASSILQSPLLDLAVPAARSVHLHALQVNPAGKRANILDTRCPFYMVCSRPTTPTHPPAIQDMPRSELVVSRGMLLALDAERGETLRAAQDGVRAGARPQSRYPALIALICVGVVEFGLGVS